MNAKKEEGIAVDLQILCFSLLGLKVKKMYKNTKILKYVDAQMRIDEMSYLLSHMALAFGLANSKVRPCHK